VTAELDDEETIKAEEDTDTSAPEGITYNRSVAARTQDESTDEQETVPVRPRHAPRSVIKSLSDDVTLKYSPASSSAAPPRAAISDTLLAPLSAPFSVPASALLPVEDDESTLSGARSGPMSGAPASSFRVAVLPRAKDEAPSGPQPRPIGPRFEPRRALGSGSGGEVTLEYDRDIDRTVAVKRLRAMHPPASLLRFAKEVRTVGGLEHPNIVPIHDVGLDERQRYYFVMKYVEGDTLQKIIYRLSTGDPEYHRRYTTSRRAEICMEIMNAIAYAHARGIIHRDLKPSNIMVGSYGEVMVMDWGIAKRLRDVKSGGDDEMAPPQMPKDVPSEGADPCLFNTSNGALIGTPLYMSPEQARGQNSAIDERSDIYSLSVMFHELFALHHYLSEEADLLAVLSCINKPDERPLTAFIGDMFQATFPCEIMHFVRKGMRKDPAERYQSMTEMIETFQQARSGKFRIQCHYSLIKRGAQAVLHFVDAHPIIVTLVSVAVVLGVPALLALLILRYV
jgi:serine/threonine protein kinase